MEELYRGKYLSVKKKDSWEYTERIGCDSAVVIIPITEDNEVVLVEQMRIPLGRTVLEFPAGLVGDDFGGESFIDAAIRELEEETGFIPVDDDDFEYFGEFCTSPGLTSEKLHLVRMSVEKEFGAFPETGIKVHIIPIHELKAWLKNKSAFCDISIKVLIYSLACGDSLCEEVIRPSIVSRFLQSFLDNMLGWTIAFCISLSIGSCTIKEVITTWKQ